MGEVGLLYVSNNIKSPEVAGESGQIVEKRKGSHGRPPLQRILLLDNYEGLVATILRLISNNCVPTRADAKSKR